MLKNGVSPFFYCKNEFAEFYKRRAEVGTTCEVMNIFNVIALYYIINAIKDLTSPLYRGIIVPLYHVTTVKRKK